MITKTLQPKPINTVFDARSIQACIEPYYPTIANGQIIFLQAGVNDTYLVDTAAQKYIFRLYRFNLRSFEDIKFEVELLKYLASEGASVSEPIINTNHQYMIPIESPEGLRYGVLFSFAEGQNINYQDDDGTLAHIYGVNLARCHQVQQGFSTNIIRKELDLDHLFHKPMYNIRKLFSAQQDHLNIIEDTADFVLTEFQKLPDDSLTEGICHGDTNCGNVHVTDLNEMTFFDFDCCGKGWLEYDLATFYWGALFEDKKERWDHFSAGYKTIFPDRKINHDSINLLIAIRQLWILGLHYDSSLLHGKNWYNKNYFEMNTGFLVEWKKRYQENLL